MSNTTLLIDWRDRWNRSLLRFIGRRVPASVDIEDLAQETYLRLLRTRTLNEVRDPRAYLLRVASHVVAEWRDSQAPSDSLATMEETLLVDDTTPECEVDVTLSQQRVNEVLASASPMMRAVLLMRLRDGRPYREIAEELGITDRQVKRCLVRGYDRLRRTIED